jgi:elongation factor P
MADTSDFKNGMAILFNGKVHTITEFQHVKPGKGPAFVRTVLKNLETGAVVDHKFRAGEKIETVFLERRPMQYLYSSGGTLHFMDMESYEQIELPTEVR